MLVFTPSIISMFYITAKRNKNGEWLKARFNSYSIFNSMCIFVLVLVGQAFKQINYIHVCTTLLLLFPAVENLKIAMAWQKSQMDTHTQWASFIENKKTRPTKRYLYVFASNGYITKSGVITYDLAKTANFWGPHRHARAYIFALLNGYGV